MRWYRLSRRLEVPFPSGAVGAIAFKRSGDTDIGECGEAELICMEGDPSAGVMKLLAAYRTSRRSIRVVRRFPCVIGVEALAVDHVSFVCSP